jgi:hypothetical protein
MLVVADSALTVFDAALRFGPAGAELAEGTVFDELPLWADGALCPAATKLLANTNQTIRRLPMVLPFCLCLAASPLISNAGMSGGTWHSITDDEVCRTHSLAFAGAPN